MCGFADRGYEEPGRPEDLPHTATIEWLSDAIATVTVLGASGYYTYRQGCETLSPNSFSDRPTLGTDSHRRNQPVGRKIAMSGQRVDSRSAAQPL
jgi:hypothetical protein